MIKIGAIGGIGQMNIHIVAGHEKMIYRVDLQKF